MLSDDTLGGLTARSRRYGDRLAIICEDRQLSFLELDDRVSILAGRFEERGIQPGDIISICGPVGWEWVAAYYAIQRAGAVANPINALLTADEVGFILRDCSARMLLADERRIKSLLASEALPPGLMTTAFEELAALSDVGDGISERVGLPGDIATVFYTSGTTGRPKGALLSHRAMMMNAGLTALMHGRLAEDVIVSALPLAHVYGNVILNSAVLVGATLVLIPAFSPEAVFDAVAQHRATRFDGVPTMYYRMLQSDRLQDAQLSTLRMCTVGGQTMPVDKMEAIERNFNCPLVELWGMSEIGGLGTTFPWTGPRTLGSIGIALPGIALRTVDQDRLPTERNRAGELQVRGPIVMLGYLGNSEATREVLDDDGWLSTGDVARIDSSGRVFIVDRVKDLILTSGHNVYPAEIERVVSCLPGVTMVGVGRDHHPEKGEVAHVYLVADPVAELTAERVIEHCRGLLAPYKLPRAVTFVRDLPQTASGKIMRRKLGESVEQ